MNKRTHDKVLHRVLVALLAVTLLFGIIAAPHAEATNYDASYINRLQDALGVNLKDYVDGSVMYQLPESVKDDDDISIVIMLDITNVMDAYEASDKTVSFKDFALHSQQSKKIAADVAAKKAQILQKLDEKGIAYTATGIDYTTILTGFEIVIKAADFKATCKSLDKGCEVMVSEAYKVAQTQLVENDVAVLDTGINDTTGIAYDGSGLVVAVLDTGLDYAHSAFSVNNFTSNNLKLTYEDIVALVGETVASQQYAGLTADDVFISNKVPFGFDYADYDPDVYSTHNNHGTHVSGIIVGNDDTIRGVAPNAQLVSMKVFSDVYDSALSSWILSALEDCVILGVDVINMSLGTACGFSRESDEEKLNGVYDKIREAGISLMVAASNSYSSAYGSEANGNLGLTSNPDTATVGSPGTYQGAMSIASIDGTKTPYLLLGETIIYFDEANDNAGKPQDFCGGLLGDAGEKEMEYVVIPGVGRSADYTGLDVKGKIALVRRGDNTFEEKALIAQSQGAVGIIIYNNVSGEIKMNVGDATLASCSISQDDGKALVEAAGEAGVGKLKISTQQKSGPFISDFSSWGPTPDLGIKPEITGFGGNILSAVTGGGYDRLSGTSMATPNLSGVALLLRQYVIENFPEIADNGPAVTSMVYRLMMSTADIILNKNGLPYAVRKQGAGLANLYDAMATTAVITTYDENGKAMDKTKLELGDDPAKTGVYTMSFTVENFGTTALSYDIGAYIMTEGVSDTLTNAGQTTVTEQGYLLTGASLEIVSVTGGSISEKNLTVAAGQNASVTVKITLSDADKAYLDASFKNGMYVEGFITLTATAGTEVDMSVPYLAFYGDWTKAPMFDKDFYETNADELNSALDEEDKNKADAYATRPIGGVSDDYVSYLGTYYFLQNPEDMVISANRDYIALSNQEGTIHSLRFVWAGLLRSAEKIVITITDDATGEVIFETVDYDVRKSYGDGGSIYPANIEIEFDTMDYNLMNNSQYTVKLQGYMDYGNGGLETNEKNTFTFPLTIDFEAPVVEDVQFRYEYDKTLKKNRLYADIAVYDNHHAMAMQLGYIVQTAEGLEMKSFAQYMTPVYSVRNGTTMVTYELTDYIQDLKYAYTDNNDHSAFVLTCYDYALNYATYEIGLPDNYVDFYMDGLDEGLTLSPNEVYSVMPSVYPATEWGELLEITSSKQSVIRVVNDKLVAVGPGRAVVKIQDRSTKEYITFQVNVLEEGDEGFRRYDKPVADNFTLTGYYTDRAYYQVSSDERDIGVTGDNRFFSGSYDLSLYPSEKVTLTYDLDAYFPNDTTVSFKSSNENIVTVNEYGQITAVAEGYASITMNVLLDGKSTYYSQSVSIAVKDPFVANGPTLSHYFGNGGLVDIPARLKLTTIGSFAFSNFDYVMKTPEELAIDDTSTSKQWFIGDNTITKVIIPEGVETISSYAFANLTALQEVVFPSTLKYIEYGAFYGCTSLQKISFSGENNITTVNQNAFDQCDLQGTLELPNVYVISNYAFAGNKDLESVVLPATLQTIGEYAFAGCESLSKVEIGASKVKYGAYCFMGCTSLTEFPTINAALIPAGMFYRSGLTSVTIGAEVNAINEFAFTDTPLESFTVASGNAAFKVQTADYVLSADGTTLVAVAPSVSGVFTAENIGGANVTKIGRGAFSHVLAVTAVELPTVTDLGAYAFGFYDTTRANTRSSLRNVTLGTLQSVGEYAFYGIRITELPAFAADATFGRYAFSMTDISSVTIPDGAVLSEGMFAECGKLETVVIGNNVTIGDYAFFTNKDQNFAVESFDYNGEKLYRYVFSSAIKNITIGDNAVIGESAFNGAASVETVTLGANATIGKMAFYNMSSLKNIDLSKALIIGEYAFSGDTYYICSDSSMSLAAVGTVGEDYGKYMYSYHAGQLAQVDLSAATEVGSYAFAYCRNLTDVVLGDGINQLGEYTFASCKALVNVNLDKVVTLGDYVFMETGLQSIDLSSAATIGKYAFVNIPALTDVILNPNGCVLGEGAFAYCAALTEPQNLGAATEIGAYAFAYAGLTSADVSGAVTIGDFAFMKESLTDFTVKLGTSLVSLGDNPFAMCRVAPFFTTETVTFNGVDYATEVFDFDLSETVRIIDGSLYCAAPNGGLVLVTYTGRSAAHVQIPVGTVRISGFAFAGSDVQNVTLPYTLTSIGHKAFFGCQQLKLVTFTSAKAPILEEEFDSAYYESLEHIPGSGNFGSYTDYDGNEVVIEPVGIVPYFMWNATGGMYSNCFYGANFVDYVGFVDNKLLMVRPENGLGYESFVMGQYFDLVINGAVAPESQTLAAIEAINRIPERVELQHEDIVLAARAAYDKVLNKAQQALVTNFSTLLSAEQRLVALKAAGEEQPPVDEPITDEEKPAGAAAIVGAVIACMVPVGLVGVAVVNAKARKENQQGGEEAPETETETEEQ